MTVVPLPAALKQEQQKMAPFRWWLFCAAAVLCVVFMQGCAQRLGLLSRWRKCVLPHERRARLWERYERYCIDCSRLEWRLRKGRCICQDGYYRDEATQNCFEEERCGQCSSARHESFNSCLGCELVCGQPVIQQCDTACKPGCQCVKGYIRRRPGGPCVPIMSCPPKCPIYMRFVLKRERCPRVCNEAREDTCLASNEGPGCVCRLGFVLKAIFGTIRTNDWCVHESMCRFPDEESQTNEGGKSDDAKGGFGAPEKGSGDNLHNDQSKGGRTPPLEPSQPKRNDTGRYEVQKIYPPLPDLNGWKKPDWMKVREPSEPTKSGKDLFSQHKEFPPLPDLKGWKGQNLMRRPEPPLPDLNGWKKPDWMKVREPSEPTKSGQDLFRQHKEFPPLPDLKGWKGQNLMRRPEPSRPNKGYNPFESAKRFPPLPDIKGWGSRDSLTGLRGGSRTNGHADGDIASTKGGYPHYPGFQSKPPDDWFIAGKKGSRGNEGLVPTKITNNWWQSKEEVQSRRNKDSLFDVDVFSRRETEESSRSKGRPASKTCLKGASNADGISKGVMTDVVSAHKEKMDVGDYSQKGVNLGAFKGAPKYQSQWPRTQENIFEGSPLKLLAGGAPDQLVTSKTSSHREVTQEGEKTDHKPLPAQVNIPNLAHEKQTGEPSKNIVKKKVEEDQGANLFTHGAILLHKLIGTLAPEKQTSEPSKSPAKKKAEESQDANIISHGANLVHNLIGTGIGMGAQFFSGLKNVTSIGGLVDHSLNVLASGMRSLTGSGDQSKRKS